MKAYPKSSTVDDSVIEVNIGTPRMVKMNRACSPSDQKKIVKLVPEFRDVFAWSYDDLKAYHTDVFQHVIPF
jgi:hypothetical protein